MRMKFKHFTTKKKKKNQLNPKEENNVANGGGGGKLCKTNREIVEVPPSQYSNPHPNLSLILLSAVTCSQLQLKIIKWKIPKINNS